MGSDDPFMDALLKIRHKVSRQCGNTRSEIERLEQEQLALTAAYGVIQEMINESSDLSFVFRGYIAGHAESRRRTIIGSVALLFALFALLAIPFKSLLQPIYVLLAVPFGIIGALVGHIVMGITPSYLSVFGMLALAGVAVNDALEIGRAHV